MNITVQEQNAHKLTSGTYFISINKIIVFDNILYKHLTRFFCIYLLIKK